MARIAESELERLKVEVSVARLAETGGIKLEKRGKDLVGLCPFHADDTPSLTITPDKNLFHCFGCGAAGGPIDWVMKKNGVSFRHAVELLREGVPSITEGTVKHSTVRALPPPVSLDADDQALLDQVVGYYHETLKRSPEALGYLQRRGIDAAAAVERFKLGFADRTLGLRLPEKNRKAGAEIRTRLAKIGLYRESGHEHFNGSLVIPILDEAGHATEVYGRKITEGLRAGTPLHLYLPGPHKGVWNLDGLKEGKGEIILCEALIDALTFWCAGYRNVTAVYGVEGFTPDHLAVFKRFDVRRVLIAFDRDDAGERGTAKISERLLAEGFDCYRVLFPKGLDANAYALKLTPASRSLGLLIRKAEWLGNGTAPSAPTSSPVETGSAIEMTAAKENDDAPIIEMESRFTDEPATAESAREPEVPSLAAIESAASADPLPASVLPAQVTAEPDAEVSERDITIRLGDRRYRVRGFDRNLAVDVMKVNLLAAYGDVFHVDTFDLYSAKARTNFIQMAAGELRLKADIVKSDLGRVLLKLESLQDERIAKTLTPEPAERAIDAVAQDAAVAYLRSPNLLDRILADFEACGLVGEATNKLVAYLAAISRKLASPLAILVQSSSAAGKSSLMDAVLAFVPEEERVRYSALTGQALYYMGETSLKHRILAICEEEGASRASYALKLLQSEGEITIASTAKDADTGNLVTQEYRVEGPVMIFLTTTAITIDEELMNRCLVLSVDEGRGQTEAIHKLQRKKRTLEGLIARAAKDEIIALHRNAQRLLRSLAVVNPYADRLSFLSDKTRTRRDHEKYLTLIDAIALLHQHQRPIKKITVPASGGTTHHGGTGASTGTAEDRTLEYVEVTLEDIAAANRMAHEVLGRSTDELPPQTRNLLKVTCSLVAERCATQAIERADLRFTRRELRERAGLSNTQIGVHLTRLVELEYVIAHRGGRGTSFVYELLYDGSADEDEARLSGLIDVDSLRSTIATTASLRGERPRFKGAFRPQNGAITEGCRVTQNGRSADAAITSVEASGDSAKTHILEGIKAPTSYTNGASHPHVSARTSSSLAASSLAAGE
jgi:DNA primase catalytic core